MENLTVIDYQNQRVLTTQQLAQAYETKADNIQMNFSRNESRFIKDRDYYLLEGAELKAFKNEPTISGFVGSKLNKLYLWTERGANRHCKILDTDMAWTQFDVLEESYFQTKKQASMCLEDTLVANILALKEVRIQGEQNAAAIKQLDVNLEKHDVAINDLSAKLTTIQTSYYTVAGYASLVKVKVGSDEAKKLGFRAAKLSNQRGIRIDKVHNAQYGQVNSYHSDILKEIFCSV